MFELLERCPSAAACWCGADIPRALCRGLGLPTWLWPWPQPLPQQPLSQSKRLVSQPRPRLPPWPRLPPRAHDQPMVEPPQAHQPLRPRRPRPLPPRLPAGRKRPLPSLAEDTETMAVARLLHDGELTPEGLQMLPTATAVVASAQDTNSDATSGCDRARGGAREAELTSLVVRSDAR